METRIILCLLPSIYLAHPIVQTESCQMPDDFDSLLATYQAKDTLSVILPLPLQQKLESLNRKPGTGFVDISTIREPEQLLYGDKTCPGSLRTNGDAPIQERSTCPYYYVISHDPLRYPVAIAEARCKCMYCFDDSTGDNLCEAVYFPKTVLRQQGCVNGTYVYHPETYYVQNACVCAKRRFAVAEGENSVTTTTAATFTFA